MNIIGPSTVSVEAAQAWARKRNSHERFVNVAPLYWQIAPRYGIPPEIPYVQAGHETGFGKYGGVVPPEYHNWCGLKTRKGGSNDAPEAHHRFPDDETGVLAHVQHLARYAGAQSLPEGDTLVDPRWELVTKFTHEVEGLGGAWAPSRTYGNGIAALAADLRSFANDGTWDMPTKPTVALAAGHHNTSGGNADEREQTGRLTPAIAQALRDRGVEVRVITPDDGRGMYPGSLSDVARQVKPTDSVFLEIHTEGTSNPDVRGVFAIYPDWATDVDRDVRDNLGPALARAISSATGLPVRGTGVMSEKQTGVGGQGDRLGVFGATEPLKAAVTRLIVEYGSHSNAADMALWAAPGFVERAAGATADAIAAFLGIEVPPKQPQDEDDHIIVNDVPIRAGFRGHFIEVGGVVYPSDPVKGGIAVFGLPLAPEYPTAFGSAQRFERYILEWHRDNAPPFDIIGTLRGEKMPERVK